MKKISGFIFDLDGVITDTAEYHYLAWKQLADENDLEFTREDNEQLRGVSRAESLRRLLKGKEVPEGTFNRWLVEKNEYYKAYLDEITPDDLLPGVQIFIESALAQNLILGIGSASKNAKSVIERLGLTSTFKVIGDGYSVVNPKPAPDLFVWVAGGFGIQVNEAVVFEDAEAGVDAAKAAGCFTVGVGQSNVQHADIHISTFEDITPQSIIEQLLNHQ